MIVISIVIDEDTKIHAPIENQRFEGNGARNGEDILVSYNLW